MWPGYSSQALSRVGVGLQAAGAVGAEAQDVPPVAVASAEAGGPILSHKHSQRKEKAEWELGAVSGTLEATGA